MKAFIPSRVAEIIFALIIGYEGVSWHLMHADGMSQIIPDYMPGDPKIWVYITGVGFILTAIAIITGFKKTLACYLFAAMMLIFAFTKHLQPALNGNPGEFMKDLVYIMCAILIGNSGAKK